jgi:hypothetical protein
VLFEDLARDPAGLLDDLFAFLGVDPSVSAAGHTVYNAAPPRALGLVVGVAASVVG